ncbi:MAG: transcription-repair coupling factor [Ruminococcaceae bacterium]|nr:transcription-repair coupling factor [Oscillospiraceae bacterium]
MKRLIEPIRQEKEYKELLAETVAQSKSKRKYPVLITGLSDGARGIFAIALSQDFKSKTGGKTLLIVPDEAAGYLVEKIFTECGLKAAVYPFRDFSYSKISASHSYEHERLSVLDKIISEDADIFIATPDAAVQFTIPKKRLEALTVSLKAGDEMPPEALTEKLLLLGYSRCDMVEGEGQFSVRGDICDVFPPKCESPIRVEYFGDEVDRIARFDIFTQRTTEMLDALVLSPGREVIIGGAEREELAKAIEGQIKKCKNESAEAELREELEAVRAGTDISFADKYISVIYPEKETLLDYFDENALVIVQEMSAVTDRLKSYDYHLRETAEALISAGLVSGSTALYGKSSEEFSWFVSDHAAVFCNTFTSSYERLSGLFNIKCKQNVSYKDNLDLLIEDLEHFIALGYRMNILTENETVSKKLCEVLLDHGIASRIEGTAEIGIPNFVSGMNIPGFELSGSKYVCLSMYSSMFSQGRVISAKRKAKSKKSSKERISSYSELAIGDYVVHENHGVGRYCGISTVTMGGVTSDYIKLEYAGDGNLYLPCTQLDMLSKYMGAGAEAGTVKLSRLGGAEWGKAKLKAKIAAKEMAKELIQLYAERMRKKGIAFDEDDALQQEFESAFEYSETDGQLEAAREIKEDMESEVPMERLLCGDVGYGKTEVALRAAFKAVRSGYQVALLVPTTILAFQHYQTILSRMRGFPVTVDMMSRFRKPKEQKETAKRLKRGEVDILVGTHRILSKDIEFKNLGLVIVDEEQRFGVAQKEKLKQLVRDVDVLTLTATPIPRTLNMAMSGIRDMSVLEDPPVDRIPVQTYVLEYDEVILAEAIKKELRRGGQVFYLHNRIETLQDIAARISSYAPDAVIAVAHGQMDKEELSDIWKEMLEGNVDILVCTTLIEAGVDIPNANTLIIDDAERYGLAQLHQIRGRVGRSGRRAYAYLTYQRGKLLTEVAEKRLAAIRDFTEFGSGFRVALKDMEIRGAGNLLGSEQHGQIESVGYDLYMKLLNEAVLEEKGERIEKKVECSVSLNTDAYIPEKYIRSTAQRIDAYKKIASVETEEDKDDVYDELADRYGTPPKQALILLDISLIRSMGGSAGFDKIELRNGAALMFTKSFDMEIWKKLLSDYKGKLFLSAGNTPYATLKISGKNGVTGEILDLLKKYIQIKVAKTVDRQEKI